MKLEGTVKTVGNIEEKGANNFKVAELFLDRTNIYQGKVYPNFAKIVFQGNNTNLFEERNVAPGDYVSVEGDIQGRYFMHKDEEKFAQDFVAWKLDIIRKDITPGTEAAAPNPEASESAYNAQ